MAGWICGAPYFIGMEISPAHRLLLRLALENTLHPTVCGHFTTIAQGDLHAFKKFAHVSCLLFVVLMKDV